jgi:Uma2 family endonuclease
MDFEIETSSTLGNIIEQPVSGIDIDIDVEKQYKRQRGKPMPSRNHAKIQRRIADDLHAQYGKKYDILPEFEIELLNKVSVPDISVFPFKPSDWENDEIRAKEPPVLAVEILSPKQILGDVLKKIRSNYFPEGIKSVWVVLPASKTITVMLSDGKIQNFNEGVLKDDITGFEADLSRIFE